MHQKRMVIGKASHDCCSDAGSLLIGLHIAMTGTNCSLLSVHNCHELDGHCVGGYLGGAPAGLQVDWPLAQQWAVGSAQNSAIISM